MARNTKAARKGVKDGPLPSLDDDDEDLKEAASANEDDDDNDTDDIISAGDSATEWLDEIEAAKTRAENWHRKGLEVIARFRNEKVKNSKKDSRQTNILWSNTEVLMSHLCVELGTPDVKRSFQQPGKKTRIARVAAEILEKVMKVENQGFDVTHEFESAIEDHLLPGRGQVWLDLDDAEDENGETNWNEAKIVHVAWDGFLTGTGRKWSELPWVGRLLLFSKRDIRKSFSKYENKIKLNYTVESGQAKKTTESYKRAAVWEIWNKETLQRIYVAEECDVILQADDDPFHLRGFFPCPEALYAIKTSNDLDPVSLFAQYEDQCIELDRLTTRAYKLVETLKYCGIYGTIGNEDSLPDINNLDDGQFLPIKNFQAVLEKGGLAALFMVRDLHMIIVAIKGVYEQRAQLVQTIYELTGISDIIRGSSDPRETASAQKLKSRFGSNRSSKRQRDVQRFVRDAYRLKAELIAEHYSREQLQEMTGILIPTKADQDKAKLALQQIKQMQQNAIAQQQAMQAQQAPQGPGAPQGPAGMNGAPQPPMPPPPQLPPIDPDSMAEIQGILAAVAWEDIQKVLRSNIRRLFMVDVETSDTAFDDEEANKEHSLEFMKVFFDTMDKAVAAVKSDPTLLPMAKEAVLFTIGAFKVGQAFEDAVNDTFDKLGKQPSGPPQPDPKAQAAAASVKLEEARTQNENLKIQNTQAERQDEQTRFQTEMQQQAQQGQQDQERHQAEMRDRAAASQAKEREHQIDEQKAMLELADKRATLALKQQHPHNGNMPN